MRLRTEARARCNVVQGHIAAFHQVFRTLHALGLQLVARSHAGRFLEQRGEVQCIKAHLYPEHVAEVALWLCADESAMCTGQTLILDGGVI